MARTTRRLIAKLEELPPWVGPAALAFGGSVLAYAVVRSFLGCPKYLPDGTSPPKAVTDEGVTVPFAEGGCDPLWPVVTNNSRRGEVAYTDVFGNTHGNWARRFGAPRDGRRHAGVDLYGNAGDVVRAMEDGTVLRLQSFHLGTDAVIVVHDSGLVVLYGEIETGSPAGFGLHEGARVEAGQPIARVGCMVEDGSGCSSHMLHLETYSSGTRENERWYGSEPPPANLLDPTEYLLRASTNL